MNPVYRKMHKNVLHPKEIDLILRILPNECAFVVETRFCIILHFLCFSVRIFGTIFGHIQASTEIPGR